SVHLEGLKGRATEVHPGGLPPGPLLIPMCGNRGWSGRDVAVPSRGSGAPYLERGRLRSRHRKGGQARTNPTFRRMGTAGFGVLEVPWKPAGSHPPPLLTVAGGSEKTAGGAVPIRPGDRHQVRGCHSTAGDCAGNTQPGEGDHGATALRGRP